MKYCTYVCGDVNVRWSLTGNSLIGCVEHEGSEC